jgi:hypothetical protein
MFKDLFCAAVFVGYDGRILRSAQVLFNSHAFTNVSIDDLMEHAGL